MNYLPIHKFLVGVTGIGWLHKQNQPMISNANNSAAFATHPGRGIFQAATGSVAS